MCFPYDFNSFSLASSYENTVCSTYTTKGMLSQLLLVRKASAHQKGRLVVGVLGESKLYVDFQLRARGEERGQHT